MNPLLKEMVRRVLSAPCHCCGKPATKAGFYQPSRLTPEGKRRVFIY